MLLESQKDLCSIEIALLIVHSIIHPLLHSAIYYASPSQAHSPLTSCTPQCSVLIPTRIISRRFWAPGLPRHDNLIHAQHRPRRLGRQPYRPALHGHEVQNAFLDRIQRPRRVLERDVDASGPVGFFVFFLRGGRVL